MTIYLYNNDLPDDLNLGDIVAIDTEAMGLNPARDRLCVVQLSSGDGNAHLVNFQSGKGFDAPNLKKLIANPGIEKLFHFARFDVAILQAYLQVEISNIYCTKIASRLCRTYTDKHGLRELCRTLLGIELNKEQQTSDWGADTLTEDQQRYAANDVLYLHALREKLDQMLIRENRVELAQSCFDFLPHRAKLDLAGWADQDIFAHA